MLARVPDTHLLLIGDGVERGALEAQATALGVAGRLHITGSVSDVTPLLPAADVLAAPSRNEGMGRVLVEAMALGLPAVGTRVGGIADVILHGEDPVARAGALIELGHDVAWRAKLGDGARPRAEAFSIRVAAAAMRAVYDRLVRSRRLAR